MRGRRSRRLVSAVLAWTLAVLSATLLFGLIDLGTVVGLSDPAYEWSMSLEASWGGLFTFVVAGSFGWIGTVPARPWPGVALLALTAAGLAAGSLSARDPGPLWVAVPLAVVTAVFAWLLRPELAGARPVWRAEPPVAVVAAAGVPLWLAYAWFTHRASATGSWNDTLGIDHWPVQVGLGLILAAGSAVLVGAWRDLALWRWAFALTAVPIAWATLRYPEREGAMPHVVWGVLIAVWGALLVGAAWWPRRGAESGHAADVDVRPSADGATVER